jgi:hypothetical protein
MDIAEGEVRASDIGRFSLAAENHEKQEDCGYRYRRDDLVR